MLRMRFDDEINFDNYDKERLREQIQNPLFRAANKKLCLAFEQYEAEEQAVVVVREFLRENPGASILKVIESTGVEIAILEKLIDKGRVEIDISPKDQAVLERIKHEFANDIEAVTLELVKKQREKQAQNSEHNGPRMYTSR